MSFVLIGTAFTTGAVVTAGATVGETTSGPLAKELVAITPKPKTDANSMDPTIFFFIQVFTSELFDFRKCLGQSLEILSRGTLVMTPICLYSLITTYNCC